MDPEATKLGSYTLVTRPGHSIDSARVAMLDANVLLRVQSWSLSSRPSPDQTAQMRPLWEALSAQWRARRIEVNWQLGALEMTWQHEPGPPSATSALTSWPDVTDMTRAGALAMCLVEEPENRADKWWSTSRRYALTPARQYLARTQEAIGSANGSELASVVAQNWAAVLLLMIHFDSASQIDRFDESMEAWWAWRRELQAMGVGGSSEVSALAQLVFFGGSLLPLDSRGRPTRVQARELLKRNEWAAQGPLRVARNVAFDLTILGAHRAYQGRPTVLVTEDKGLLALAALPMEDLQFGDVQGTFSRLAEGSRLRGRETDPEFLAQLNRYGHRPTEDLLTAQDCLGLVPGLATRVAAGLV